jgi:transaldolase
MGCHIITAPADILKKLPALGTQTGAQLSLGAVKAFRDDALAAGLTLSVDATPSLSLPRERGRVGTG